MNDNGTAYTSGVLAYVRLSKQVAINRTGMDFGPHGVATVTSENYEKTWSSTNEYHTVTGVFDNANVKYMYYSEELFDSSTTSKCCSNANCILKHVEPTAGYPALVGWGLNTYFNAFSVYLNSTDAPDAIVADEKPAAPEADITITGEGTAAVEAVVGSENNYTVTLAPAVGYKVKTLSLIVNGDMRVNLNHDSTGLVYTFTSEDLNATTISVEYIPDDGTFNTVMAGASVWEERSAIRFGARTDLIKRSTTNTEVGTLDNRIKVGDTVYEITEVGMLLIPKGLLKGELTVDTKNVARQQVTKVVTLTDTFSDIAINLVGIPTSYYDVEICSRMYVAYEENGETKYVYTDVIVRTYNQVLKAIGK